MLPDNKISVHEFSQFFQFNFNGELLLIIDLINQGLLLNGFQSSITEAIKKPASFEPQGVTGTSFRNDIIQDVNGAFYELSLHGNKITGYGQFVKYTFFKRIEESVNTIEDLMSLYVSINILTARECAMGMDTYYMCCDDWVTDESRVNGNRNQTIKKEFELK